jgi:hypothetical protein
MLFGDLLHAGVPALFAFMRYLLEVLLFEFRRIDLNWTNRKLETLAC